MERHDSTGAGRTDAADTDIDALFEALGGAAARAIPEPQITLAVQQAALRTTRWNGNELTKQVQQVAKINLFDDTTGLADHLGLFVAENVRLVKSLVADHLEDLKGIVTRGARQGLHHTEVADQIAARFGVAKKRAALIATDQIGKLNGELNQLRQQNLGVRRYRWSSSQDERVRKRHRQLDGTIQTWKDPPVVDQRTGERGHPGQPIRCRCSAIPIIDDVLVEAGLMDPQDVELQQPAPGRQPSLRPVPLPPGPLPPEPPPTPPPPSAANTNQEFGPTVPANTNQGGGGAGAPPTPPGPPGAGGSGGGTPPGGSGPPKPPDEPRRRRALDELRAGLGRLPAQGGHAAEARGAMRSLMADTLGVQPATGKSMLDHLEVVSGLPFAGVQRADGSIRLNADVVRGVRSLLAGVRRGVRPTLQQVDALATLLHEELHATGSYFASAAYQGAGRLVEEVATETVSRDLTRLLLGSKLLGGIRSHHPLAVPTSKALLTRAYDAQIVGIIVDIQSVTGSGGEQALRLLRAAALGYKRGTGTLMTSEAAAAQFVDAVPGLSDAQRTRLRRKLAARGNRRFEAGR